MFNLRRDFPKPTTFGFLIREISDSLIGESSWKPENKLGWFGKYKIRGSLRCVQRMCTVLLAIIRRTTEINHTSPACLSSDLKCAPSPPRFSFNVGLSLERDLSFDISF